MNTLTVQQAKRFGTYQCTTDALLGEAAKKMVEEDISGLVVVDSEGYLAGIFTRSDLLRAGLEKNWRTQTVEKYMTRDVVTVRPHELLSHVAELLMEWRIHRVVIVHEEHDKLRPLGVISDADLVFHLAKEL